MIVDGCSGSPYETLQYPGPRNGDPIPGLFISQGMSMLVTTPLERHYAPKDLGDRVACALTRLLRFFGDAFFTRRHGHRAVVPAPRIAIEYWKLAPEARLRDVNHRFADELA